MSTRIAMGLILSLFAAPAVAQNAALPDAAEKDANVKASSTGGAATARPLGIESRENENADSQAAPTIALNPIAAPAQWAQGVYREAKDSIVRIEGHVRGTGFVFGDSRHVATAFHVIEDPRSLEVVSLRGERMSARVVAADKENDLAILEVEKDIGRPLVARIDAPNPGSAVLAIGHPLFHNLKQKSVGRINTALPWTAQQGIVSGSNDFIIQTDVRVTHGSSGGPLLDEKGRLIGICSSGASPIAFFGRAYLLDALWKDRGRWEEYNGRTEARGGATLSIASESDATLYGFGLYTGVNVYNKGVFTLRGSYFVGSGDDLAPDVASESHSRWQVAFDAAYRISLGKMDLDVGPGVMWNHSSVEQRILRSDGANQWVMDDRESTTNEFVPTFGIGLKSAQSVIQGVWTPRLAEKDYRAFMVNLVFIGGGD